MLVHEGKVSTSEIENFSGIEIVKYNPEVENISSDEDVG